MTTPRDSEPEAAFEELLARALDTLERDGVGGVEALLAAAPQHAMRLRQHLQRLDHLGLMSTCEPTATTVFPERLGDFRLLRRLGEGGMGVVYLAEQLSLGRRVALKLIRPEHHFFDGTRERFRREVEAVARLQHTGIVQVHAAGEDAGVPWLAMEYVRGASLDQVLQALTGRTPNTLRGSDLVAAVARIAGDEPSPEPAGPPAHGPWVTACLRLVREVAGALHHAHQRGVLHRDVKPSNVMLTLDGRPLLLDFGLARTGESVRLTRTGGVLGSPAYMAPEQMRGDHAHIDERTDVYALGVTLIELLTLASPFAEESLEATRSRVLAGVLPPLRRRNPAIPRDVELVCRKATDLDSGRRYHDAAAFAEDLDNLIELRPIRAVPPSLATTTRRWTQRHPARATALLAAFLLLFVAPTAFLLQQQFANERIRAALTRAGTDRDRAVEAVKTMLVRVAGEDLLQVPRMQHVRRDLLSSARAFHEQFLLDSGDDPALLDQAAESAQDLALLDSELGQHEQAFASAARAVELARRLHARDATPRARRLLVTALSLEGSLEYTMSRLEDARRDLVDAANLAQEPAAGEEGQRLLIERMRVDRALALVRNNLGEEELARAAQRAALATWHRLAPTLRGGPQWDDAFEQAYGTASDLVWNLLRDDQPEAVLAALQQADELRRDVDLPQARITIQHQAAGLEMVRARLPSTSPEQCAASLQKALDLLAPSLAINPENNEALRLEASVLNSMALLAHQRGDAGAADLLDRSVQRLRTLVASDPTVVDNKASLATNLVNLGAWELDGGHPDAAVRRFEEAGPLCAEALASAPSRQDWQTLDYNMTWFLGQAHAALGHAAEAAAAAVRMVQRRGDDAHTLRIAAGLTATALRHLAADEGLDGAERDARRRELQTRALAWLREAAQLGNTDHDWLATSDEFAPLRTCAGFDEILATIAANKARAAAPSGGR